MEGRLRRSSTEDYKQQAADLVVSNEEHSKSIAQSYIAPSPALNAGHQALALMKLVC
jgi:hypothetical protein